ncbi:MAG: hypothetical protein Q8O40_08265 [Chloroflexota bacterium]|nr:hypothetical protein [Chloroflexota bacterium]
METPKAKVFISCGQRTDAERATAAAIEKELVALGFETYVAVQRQTLEGLKDSIFAHLSDSEYFLFVDFRREQLPDPILFRGSLFSHQELAVASYLDLRFMGFQQSGVKREGVLSFLQGNCLPFSDPTELPALVQSQAVKLGWRPDWKNALQITRQPSEHHDPHIGDSGGPLARYFHLKVTNLNKYKPAVGCRAYIGDITRLGASMEGDWIAGLGAVELKWGGYVFPEVILPPSRSRDIDAGRVLHAQPSIMEFPSFADSTYYYDAHHRPWPLRGDLPCDQRELPRGRVPCQGNAW